MRRYSHCSRIEVLTDLGSPAHAGIILFQRIGPRSKEGLPARAGMLPAARDATEITRHSIRKPSLRIRGGAPRGLPPACAIHSSSPARARMTPADRSARSPLRNHARTCGDTPTSSSAACPVSTFSPHVRVSPVESSRSSGRLGIHPQMRGCSIVQHREQRLRQTGRPAVLHVLWRCPQGGLLQRPRRHAPLRICGGMAGNHGFSLATCDQGHDGAS